MVTERSTAPIPDATVGLWTLVKRIPGRSLLPRLPLHRPPRLLRRRRFPRLSRRRPYPRPCRPYPRLSRPYPRLSRRPLFHRPVPRTPLNWFPDGDR